MYHDLLGRSPTRADSTQWQNVLASSNAMTVALDIESSTEHRSDLIAQLYQDDLDSARPTIRRRLLSWSPGRRRHR